MSSHVAYREPRRKHPYPCRNAHDHALRGAFTLTRIEAEREGKASDHVFDPPYHLLNGETYAIYQTPAGRIELWQVECVERGNWRWVQEAKRAKSKWPAEIVAVNGIAMA